jgi:hypothetical protein
MLDLQDATEWKEEKGVKNWADVCFGAQTVVRESDSTVIK